ncbi:DUF4365 domain-containing protein [Flavobacterium sp. N1994]|uniref:DUF4365 domain-containing protein n=1 Tax=Flavobacterium sp. N1994 TaxID=2986827 RepID=UPI00222156B2|nr:DUF4365 domain-containing protein [Flavobacterium sp. N1994]
MDDLPIYDKTEETANLGIILVSSQVVKTYSWILREQFKNDLGIDVQIEIANENRQGTGRLIAAQVKAGPSYFQEPTENGFVYRGKKKHLKYWLNHSLPVIVILCDLVNDISYWTEVNRTSITKLKKGWKIIIPKNQILDESNRRNLLAIAGAPQHPDIVELLIFKFLQEKYHKYSGNRISITPILHEPRDFHYFTCLAEIENLPGLVYVAHYYDLYKDLDLEDVKKFISWRELNIKSCGHSNILPNLFILIVSEKKENLIIKKEIQELIENTEKLSIIRLYYENKPLLGINKFYSLTEIGEDGEEIYDY